MSIHCIWILNLSIFYHFAAPVTKVCPPKWKAYNDKCYFLIFNTTSWLNARQNCHMNGGDLATVNSQAEQDLVYSIMSDSMYNTAIIIIFSSLEIKGHASSCNHFPSVFGPLRNFNYFWCWSEIQDGHHHRTNLT